MYNIFQDQPKVQINQNVVHMIYGHALLRVTIGILKNIKMAVLCAKAISINYVK